MQKGDATREVIEHQQRGRCGKGPIGHLGLWFGVEGQAFEQPHDVVAGDANEPSRERQALDLGLRPGHSGECLAQCTQVGIASRRPRLFLPIDGQAGGIHAQLERIAKTQERIAREAFAAFDALEEESRLQRPEFQER
jgi:hypothetical protein